MLNLRNFFFPAEMSHPPLIVNLQEALKLKYLSRDEPRKNIWSCQLLYFSIYRSERKIKSRHQSH